MSSHASYGASSRLLQRDHVADVPVISASASPLVSVVLPVRNGAATIARAVTSIQIQAFSDWEMLVVDDGSSDGTREIVAEIARNDPRVRMLSPADAGSGIVAALNRGLAVARGEFVARMDADDQSLPGRLAAQVSFLRAPENHEVGLVSCRVAFGGDRMANAGYALHVDWINALLAAEQIALNRFVESPLAHPSVMFRHELVERHGGYRAGDFPEDYELWLRWLDAGVKMAKLSDELLCWNDSPTRLSRADARYNPEAFFRVKAEWIAREVKRKVGARRVLIWGAGRPTRKRAAHLEAYGVRIAGYVDVDAKKTTAAIGGTGLPVLGYETLPPPAEAFVLVYVSSRGAREFIRTDLCARGFVEGRDFLMCA
jgi:glycosyltransferase involved in cell wall biosynthesis